MAHAAAQKVPIIVLAGSLGLAVTGRHAPCFNAEAHRTKKDERPSLAFFDGGRFKCFACGVRGDSIDLVRAVRNCGFRDAVTWIESLGGKAISESPQQERGRPQKSSRQTDGPAIPILNALHRMCYDIGPEMPAGVYFKKRGLDLDLVNRHHVGQMLDTREVWSDLVCEFGLDVLKASGLVSRSDKFLFARHRLLFFYLDDDWPVYIQARDMTGEADAKELSLAGLRSPVPYNVDLLQGPQSHIYVCEGCIDTLSALQLGMPAIGVPGVMGFQKDWYARFNNVDRVTVLFDNDEAGRRQAAELRSQFRLRGITADSQHPQHVKDVNDMLIARNKGIKNV